ncbi:MAG: AAA family ATPase [Prevotella sp.]|nr:AAA family ATPase [Prevotella sp.]
MRETNRLINDFRYQTKNTIWKQMDAMGLNYAVYSNHLHGLSPYLMDKEVYIYANTENIVVVCVDCCGHNKEQTYDESARISPFIYYPGRFKRESMVWKLYDTMRIMKDRLRKCKFETRVYGILLTEAQITNFEDLEEMWATHDIKVIDNFSTLKYRRASVNDDKSLRGMLYYDAALDSELDCPENESKAESYDKYGHLDDVEHDEFERMLNDFINRPSMDDDDDDNDDDDISLPSDKIIQNANLSVKVQILKPIMNPRKELDKLVGCDNIKCRMDELVAMTRYNTLIHRAFPAGKLHKVSLHSIFLGRPGTGKTTVCKIFGSLLKQAGALSKGHVVVCDRGTFIGTLWGDEERALRQVLKKAKGGVLMIDEAYLLNSKNENDPGKLVIQLLMDTLADEKQRDIAIVLCGYKEPMEKLLELNPGLQSRFPNKFEFQDFTIDELLEITKLRVKDYDYQFTEEAWDKYRSVLSNAYRNRDPHTWGNARFVANQLERIYIQHASRCVKFQPVNKYDLRLLTPYDIVPIEVPRSRTKMGF